MAPVLCEQPFEATRRSLKQVEMPAVPLGRMERYDLSWSKSWTSPQDRATALA